MQLSCPQHALVISDARESIVLWLSPTLIYKAFPNLKLGLHTGEEKGSYLTVTATAVL